MPLDTYTTAKASQRAPGAGAEPSAAASTSVHGAGDFGAVTMHPADNVAIARVDLEPGSASVERGPTCLQPIPRGHKVALRAIAIDEPIVKYNTVIGFARAAIAAGQHVHRHNLGAGARGNEGLYDYAFCRDRRPTDFVPAERRAVFQGFVREGGRVGTRNFIGVISTVNCSATVARCIAEHYNHGPGWLPATVDGVVALTHGSGCGLGGNSAGHELLQRTLAGFANHPNFGGLLIVGLGCETLQIERLLERYPLSVAGGRLRTMTIQEEGGSQTTIRRGITEIAHMLGAVADVKRQPVDASHLIIGLQCGGSDAFSSMTANPALGHAVDLLVRHGGTAILSETPEIYGVEHTLTRRAASPEVAQALLDRIEWWREYTRNEPGQLDNNPSPGNHAGGLASILEKSLGAAMKGGTTDLRAVYRYAEPVTERGLVFMDSPGFDPCSATGQIASGANLICFTTGRGSAFGAKPVPSLKLATTSLLYRKQYEDMDLDCGTILDGHESLAECGERIFAELLAVASGQRTKSEAHGYGDHEFVPWQMGAVF
ncbi:MAG: altronate dehydratase [Proteobacteria bacterium]|nr:altronate dehydratase [Burkholderiales bacterium]